MVYVPLGGVVVCTMGGSPLDSSFPAKFVNENSGLRSCPEGVLNSLPPSPGVVKFRHMETLPPGRIRARNRAKALCENSIKLIIYRLWGDNYQQY